MGKQKTRKAVAKRFKKTGTGKIKFARPGKGHLLTNKSRTRKRHLRSQPNAAKGFEKTLSIALG